MFGLTRQEKIIILFLSLSLVVGLGVNNYKKAHQKIELEVSPYKLTGLKEADRLIARASLVNINSLEVSELTRLPGIGSAIARRIIEHHRRHGRFRNKEQLMQVSGIGPKKFERLKHLIALE